MCYFLVLSMLFCFQISNIYNSQDFVDISEYDLYLSLAIYPDSDSDEEIDHFGNFSLEFELDEYSDQYDESAKLSQLAYMPDLLVAQLIAHQSVRIEAPLFTSITTIQIPSTPPPV
jgi:hypothetical protein